MNTAELIIRLGPELGVYGVAVHAFVEAQPDCRYDQIMAGLRMSKAQVLRTLTKLEEVGAVERVKGTTDFGTSKPTVVRCLSQIHQQKRVSTSETPANTEVASDNPVMTGVSHGDTVADVDTPISAVSLTATPVNTEESLSDAKDGCLSQRHPPKQQKSRGPKVAPSKAETTNKNKSQATPETAPKNAAEVVDWSEIGPERSRMIDALKNIIGAIPNPQGERAACNWLLKNRAKLKATTDDFIECLREQEDDVKTGNWRRKVSWLIVKSEFPSWQLRARSTEVKSAKPSENRNGDRPRKVGLAEHARQTAEYFGLGGKAPSSG